MYKVIIQTLLVMLSFNSSAFAYDEVWGNLSLRHSVDEEHQIVGEFRRRDLEGLVGEEKSSDLFRLSWSTKWEHFNYLVGITYAEFETNTSHELRLHQFLSQQYKYKNLLNWIVRLGTEHRDFSSDARIYHRMRLRFQLNPMPEYKLGPAFYNEVFFAFNGADRFATGVNENRTGLGLRYTYNPVELYAYHTFAYLKFPDSSVQQDWWQLQFIFNF